jgi:galactokinase
MNQNNISEWLIKDTTHDLLKRLYSETSIAHQRERIRSLTQRFNSQFPHHHEFELFSASGRVELIGNHTDHQGGHVLACAINLDTLACATINHDHKIRLHSSGYDPIIVDCNDLSFRKEEVNTTLGLLKGLAYYFSEHTYITGVDIVMESDIQAGSGLSSSASFECLILTIFNTFFQQASPLSSLKIAQIGQRAENHYFGKPSGLMDQLTIANGGICVMDFSHNEPTLKKLINAQLLDEFNLCIVHTGGSHDDLTHAYAQIVNDNFELSNHFGVSKLSMISQEDFLNELPHLYQKFPSRLLLRAFHFFKENQRVLNCVQAIEQKNTTDFLKHIIDSSHSSFEYLDNVNHPTSSKQGLAIGLALAHHVLEGVGAYRLHGGGFAGTILCICPHDKVNKLKKTMELIFGSQAFTVLKVRNQGVIQLK